MIDDRTAHYTWPKPHATNNPRDEDVPRLCAFMDAADAKVLEIETAIGLAVTGSAFDVIGDGVADDTAGVQAAVAAAHLAGTPLYWPAGTYLTTASIPNFHNVRHLGPGVVKRGATLFTVSPRAGTVNDLFVSPTAADGNDGLSDAEPMPPQRAAAALRNYGPVLEGSWGIAFADGAYSLAVSLLNTCIVSSFLSSTQPIRIYAVSDTGAMRADPAVIIDEAGVDVGTGIGGGGDVKFQITGIKVANFKAGALPHPNGFHAGFKFGQGTDVLFKNCHAIDCDIGIYVFNQVFYQVRGCFIDGCGTGIQELFHVTRNARFGAGEHTVIQNGTYGIRAKEFCTGHGDDLEIINNTRGVLFSRCCTMNAASATFHLNDVGVSLRNGSFFYAGNIDWGFGTASANAVPFRCDSTSSFATGEEEAEYPTLFTGRGERMMGSYTPDPAYTLTGNTNLTDIAMVGKLRAGALVMPGSYVRMVIIGRKTGTAGTINLHLSYGNNAAVVATVAAAQTSFKAELYLFAKADGKQRAFAVVEGGGADDTASGGDRTYNTSTSGDGGIFARAILSNSADTLTVDGVWTYTTEPLLEEPFL